MWQFFKQNPKFTFAFSLSFAVCLLIILSRGIVKQHKKQTAEGVLAITKSLQKTKHTMQLLRNGTDDRQKDFKNLSQITGISPEVLKESLALVVEQLKKHKQQLTQIRQDLQDSQNTLDTVSPTQLQELEVQQQTLLEEQALLEEVDSCIQQLSVADEPTAISSPPTETATLVNADDGEDDENKQNLLALGALALGLIFPELLPFSSIFSGSGFSFGFGGKTKTKREVLQEINNVVEGKPLDDVERLADNLIAMSKHDDSQEIDFTNLKRLQKAFGGTPQQQQLQQLLETKLLAESSQTVNNIFNIVKNGGSWDEVKQAFSYSINKQPYFANEREKNTLEQLLGKEKIWQQLRTLQVRTDM